MKSKMDEIVNRNEGRFGAIKNLGITLKLLGFHAPDINGKIGDIAYKASGDYRAHAIVMEQQKATALVESRMLQFNR